VARVYIAANMAHVPIISNFIECGQQPRYQNLKTARNESVRLKYSASANEIRRFAWGRSVVAGSKAFENCIDDLAEATAPGSQPNQSLTPFDALPVASLVSALCLQTSCATQRRRFVMESAIVGAAIVVALYVAIRLALRHYFPLPARRLTGGKPPRHDSEKSAGAPCRGRLHAGRSGPANGRSLRRTERGRPVRQPPST
jgi:hypothetical protein